MLRVLELFAGIGACSKALTNLGIEHEIVDAVEIDKYAIKSFNAIHGTSFEPQDICEWDKDIEADLIMHGSPCQDFSVAGKGAGGDEGSGTRSSLLYETLRIVERIQPDIVIWENVKNLLSKKHRHNFEAYLEAMKKLGYHSSYQVMNAKDYGVPQNRERVFTVSIRNDLDVDFEFPKPQELTIRLKDALEPQVDEKYYLSDEQTKRLKTTTYNTRAEKAHGGRQPKMIARTDNHQKGGVYETNLVSPTLTATTYKQPTQIAEPIIVASRGRGEHNMQHLEPRKDSLTNTITSVQKDNYVANSFRIRKLTPRECWRLMGFDDEDFDRAQAVGISSTQLYKQAGNSIVVNCLEAIFRGIEWNDD